MYASIMQEHNQISLKKIIINSMLILKTASSQYKYIYIRVYVLMYNKKDKTSSRPE